MKKTRLILTALAIALASSFQSQAQTQCDSSNYQVDTCDNVFEDLSIEPINMERAAGAGTVFYMHSSADGHPWDQTTNPDSMDAVFGGGDWTQEFFETADVATLFSEDTEFIYMDGSDGGADAINAFVTANGAAMETWVNDGGKLFINVASQGPDVPVFGDISINYIVDTPTNVDASLPGHPAFAGPLTVSVTSFEGNSYAHNAAVGTGLTSILEETGGANVVLAEGVYGNGFVLVGGMTTTNWHTPAPDANNFRTNLLSYMDGIKILGTDDTVISGFSMSPNPTSTSFKIEGDFTVAKVAIFNVLGQSVLEASSNTVDVTNLNAGMYLVTVTDMEGNIATKRLLKR